MNLPTDQSITSLLQQSQQGDQQARGQLIELLYHDIKRLAAKQKAKFHHQTLNTTAIVHEAWLKLDKQQNIQGRQHFMATAALAIRHLLINEAKKKQSQKRQPLGLATYVSAIHGDADPMAWLLRLDELLTQLEHKHPRLAEVFQLRYFVGMSHAEMATLLDVNVKTIQRDWIKAKCVLASHLLA